jgi:hypothetical protein
MHHNLKTKVQKRLKKWQLRPITQIKRGDNKMSNGNKHDNGVHEVGKLETLQAYQEDTPGQQVEKYLESINEVIEEKKEKQKKSFMKVFQNPLKGFPYNEELEDNFVKSIQEGRMKELHGYIEKGMSAKQIAKKMKLDVKTIQQLMDESINEEAPCWKGYKQVGMKKKNGKEVPNCVPMNEAELKEAGIDKSEVDLSHVDEELRNCGCGKTPCETYGEEIEEGKKESVTEKFEALFEAKKLKNLMPEFEKIVKTKGAAKVSGVMIDMFTASVIVKAYEKVNDKNKKRMETSDVYTLIKLAQKMMGLKDEKIVEDYKKVIKMFPRDRDWKKLITKHKRAIDDFRKNNKDLPSKVEDELLGWASQTGEVSGKHDAEDFILSILDEETLTEGTWAVPDSYPKLVKLNGFLKQKANYKTAQEVHKWHINVDQYFGDDSFSDDIDAYKTTLKGGERSFYDKGSLHGQEYLDRMKKYNKIKEGTDLRDVLEKQLSDWTGGVLKFKNHEIVQMPRDWYTTDNPNTETSPVKAKLESVDYTSVNTEGFKRGRGNLKFKKSPPIKVEGKMDGNKLTGQEISVYFRRNKVRDKQTRKAVEIALDHGGAMNYAIKQIEKLKRGLSKSKEVQKALNYANFGEQVRVQEVGFMFKEDSPVAGNIQVEGDPYIPQKKGINKNIANYWKKEIKGVSQKELEKIQSMYMITDHSGVVQMYKAGKRAFIKSLKD